MRDEAGTVGDGEVVACDAVFVLLFSVAGGNPSFGAVAAKVELGRCCEGK